MADATAVRVSSPTYQAYQMRICRPCLTAQIRATWSPRR
jgi:hypothetical protein